MFRFEADKVEETLDRREWFIACWNRESEKKKKKKKEEKVKRK